MSRANESSYFEDTSQALERTLITELGAFHKLLANIRDRARTLAEAMEAAFGGWGHVDNAGMFVPEPHTLAWRTAYSTANYIEMLTNNIVEPILDSFDEDIGIGASAYHALVDASEAFRKEWDKSLEIDDENLSLPANQEEK